MTSTISIDSTIYRWRDVQPSAHNGPTVHAILHGKTMLLSNFTVEAVTLSADTEPQSYLNSTAETLIIIKSGALVVSLNEARKILSTGSVLMVMPNEEVRYSSANNGSVTFYLLQFVAREGNGRYTPSFFIDEKTIPYQPHEKGGVRRYYDQATMMFNRAEMHVTTLNPQFKSHPPHTHLAAEIILMISGHTEMQIGEQFFQGTDGDLFYLESDIPHAIQNIGTEPCQYFAFQWE